MTADELKDLERLAGLGLTQEQIADWFGYTSRTLRNKLKEPEAISAYKSGKTRALELVTGQLFKNIRKGDKASIFFYLKTQGGWRETDDKDAIAPDEVARMITAAVQAMSGTVNG